ncbi:MAG: hypothetical protein Q8N37_01365 [bacterium]|nr:hypothetical protein [bacterium]
MKIKQEIPWYKNDYLRQKWIKQKSNHYVFYYLKNSLAENDIYKIIKLKEKHHNKILSFLDLKNKQIIHYYIYPSLKSKASLMGDDSPGNVIWGDFELVNSEPKTNKFEIHTIYNDKCQFIGEHEDTHFLSLSLGLSIYLFCEGLAQFMEGNLFGKDIDIISKELLSQKKLYSIKNLIDNKNWEKVDSKIIYPEVGSFVRFLINTYGWDKFKKTYQRLSRLNNSEENLKIIENGFEKSIEELEKEWKGGLK